MLILNAASCRRLWKLEEGQALPPQHKALQGKGFRNKKVAEMKFDGKGAALRIRCTTLFSVDHLEIRDLLWSVNFQGCIVVNQCLCHPVLNFCCQAYLLPAGAACADR